MSKLIHVALTVKARGKEYSALITSNSDADRNIDSQIKWAHESVMTQINNDKHVSSIQKARSR